MGRRGYIQESVKIRKISLRERLGRWLIGEQEVYDPISIEIETLNTEPFRFSVYRANGGTIVETRSWNTKKDQNDVRLHIITDDKELGHELAKIITMESLRG